MVSIQFKLLKYITPADITGTGCPLGDVQAETIFKLDRVCKYLDRKCTILSLTTGQHSSPEHPQGKAVDFFYPGVHTYGEAVHILKAIFTAGFTGIGMYWNGTVFSFHADIRDKYAWWSAIKDENGKWVYGGLITDLL